MTTPRLSTMAQVNHLVTWRFWGWDVGTSDDTTRLSSTLQTADEYAKTITKTFHRIEVEVGTSDDTTLLSLTLQTGGTADEYAKTITKTFHRTEETSAMERDNGRPTSILWTAFFVWLLRYKLTPNMMYFNMQNNCHHRIINDSCVIICTILVSIVDPFRFLPEP